MVMPVTLRRYTVDEIDAFPPDGNRYELLDGVLFVSPAPGLAHGIVVFALGAIFREFLAPEVGAFVAGPGVVELRPSLRMEPDVLVGRLGTGTGSGWDRVAERWLAIEVSGSGSRIYDRDYKRTSYLAVGYRKSGGWNSRPGSCSVIGPAKTSARSVIECCGGPQEAAGSWKFASPTCSPACPTELGSFRPPYRADRASNSSR